MFPSCFYQNQPQVGHGWSKSKLLHPKHPPNKNYQKKANKNQRQNASKTDSSCCKRSTHNRRCNNPPSRWPQIAVGKVFLSSAKIAMGSSLTCCGGQGAINMFRKNVRLCCMNIVKHPPNRKHSTETPDVDTELCRGVVVTATLAIFEILNCNRSCCIFSPNPFWKWKDALLSEICSQAKRPKSYCREMIIERHEQIAKVRCGEDRPQNPHVKSYCWWLKSCTTEIYQNLVNSLIRYLSTGANSTNSFFRFYLSTAFRHFKLSCLLDASLQLDGHPHSDNL